MKNGMLKLSAISLVLCCSIANAYENSVIPPLKPGFAFTITGLYLEPSASNLGYAVYTTPLPLPAPNWQQKIVNPSYSGAFDLGVQYNLMNTREQIKFDWLYFTSKDKASTGSLANTSVGPAYYYGPAQQFILNTSANSTVRFDIDDASLVFGHLINLSDNIQFQPFFGLSVAYLKENISNNYYGTDPVYGPYTHGVNSQSQFIGVGPRLGLDSSYFFTKHFAITAEVAGDLLAGNVNYNTNFDSQTAYSGDLSHNTTLAHTAMANQNQYRVVPEAGAKISMLYNIAFDNSQSELTLQAGYMYSVYFNAIQQVLPQTLVAGSWEAGSVAIVNQTQQQSNIDLRGPFVSATFKF